jgi:hypothetical protein
MLTNTSYDADSHIFSLKFAKEFENGLDLSFGYAYMDSKDVSPMTSFTAESSFESTALIDLNNPGPGTTNYEIPQRYTLRASWGHEFWNDLETRITLQAYMSEGQPQSFVMDSSPQESEIFCMALHGTQATRPVSMRLSSSTD